MFFLKTKSTRNITFYDRDSQSALYPHDCKDHIDKTKNMDISVLNFDLIRYGEFMQQNNYFQSGSTSDTMRKQQERALKELEKYVLGLISAHSIAGQYLGFNVLLPMQKMANMEMHLYVFEGDVCSVLLNASRARTHENTLQVRTHENTLQVRTHENTLQVRTHENTLQVRTHENTIIPLKQREDILQAVYDKIMKSQTKTITGVGLEGCDIWSVEGASGDVCVSGSNRPHAMKNHIIGEYAIFFDLDNSDIMLRYECLQIASFSIYTKHGSNIRFISGEGFVVPSLSIAYEVQQYQYSMDIFRYFADGFFDDVKLHCDLRQFTPNAYNCFFYRIWLHKVFIPSNFIVVDDCGESLGDSRCKLLRDYYDEDDNLENAIVDFHEARAQIDSVMKDEVCEDLIEQDRQYNEDWLKDDSCLPCNTYCSRGVECAAEMICRALRGHEKTRHKVIFAVRDCEIQNKCKEMLSEFKMLMF